jgi:hypothetical protein
VVTVAAVAVIAGVAARVAGRARSGRRQVAETARQLSPTDAFRLSAYLGPNMFEQAGLSWPAFPLDAAEALPLLVDLVDSDELDLIGRNIPGVLELSRLDRPPAAPCRVLDLGKVRAHRAEVS